MALILCYVFLYVYNKILCYLRRPCCNTNLERFVEVPQRCIFDSESMSKYGLEAPKFFLSCAIFNHARDWPSVGLPQLNKDTNDLLWLAIVGLTDQYIHQVSTEFVNGKKKYQTGSISYES